MTPDDLRLLWGRFLAGEDLLVDDQRRLVEGLEADPALRAELLDDVELDGVLRSLGAVLRSGEGFVQTLAGSVDPERDATRFVKKVELRLADGPPTPPAKRETPRPFPVRSLSRRFVRSAGPSDAGWKAALAASAVFAVILLFAAASTKPARPKPDAPPAPGVVGVPKPPPPVLPEPPRSEEEQRIRLQLERIEQEQERLQQAPSQPAESSEERGRRLKALEEERRRTEAEMQRVIDENRRRPEPPAPLPSVPPSPPPPGTRSERLIAAADALKVQAVSGPVYFTATQAAVKAGQVLPPGRALYTHPGAKVTLGYADGTRIEVQAETEVSNRTDEEARRFFVLRGAIASDIEPQAPGRPMIFETPTAEARILGTSIRLAVLPGKSPETTLEVAEGKVELKRLSDGATTEVSAGQFAIAAAGVDLKPGKTFPAVVRINFGPADTVLPAGWLNDSGQSYDAARGYGWDGIKDGRFIAFWKNPNGSTEERRHGRTTALRPNGLKPEDLPFKATSVVAGWGEALETWWMPVPNGLYRVRVCVGDQGFEQGPHVVALNGRYLWPSPPVTRPNRNNGFLEGVVDLEVRNGELRMTVGGLPVKPSVDGSMDTILNYIVIERLSK